MNIPLRANGFTIVIGTAAAKVGKVAERAMMDAAMTGYGEARNTDIGRVTTGALDIAKTVESFAAIPMAKDAQHSAFSVFRDAIANQAEVQSNMLQAQRNPVVLGSKYTGFYADLYNGQNAVSASMLTSVKGSPEAKLDFSSVNFNDADSVNKYLKNVQDYAQKINLREHIGLNKADWSAGSQELMILMHTETREAYGQYIQTFENQIRNNFQREMTQMQDGVKAMGFKGNIRSIKDLEKFKATVPLADKYKVQQLIDATQGKINKVDRYILSRINNGEIDINKIIATGQFNGVQLDAKAQAAFKALNVYANSDSIATAYHNETLQKIGYTSSKTTVDLNDLNQVKSRIKEFEDALSQAGYGTLNGKALEKLSLKELRQVDLSKIQDKNVADAIKQYIGLREHKEILDQAKHLKQNMAMRAVMLTRKLLGDSDLSQSIGQIMSLKRNVQTAMKIWSKFGAPVAKRIWNNPMVQWLRTDVQRALAANKTFVKNIIGRAKTLWSNSPLGRAASQVARSAQSLANSSKPLQALKNAQTAHSQAKAAKVATKAAKANQKKLIAKAGKKAGNMARGAAKLAKTGQIGTTGASKAAQKAAKQAAQKAAAKSILKVCLTVIVVVLIIGIVCSVLGGLFMMIGSSTQELDNTLLGKMANWVRNFKWPWQATEEEQQNVLNYTIQALLAEERNAKEVGTQLETQYGKDAKFWSGLKPNKSSDENNVTWTRSEFKTDTESVKNTTKNYIFLNKNTGAPITEYSNVKLVISMAHVYTYHLQYDTDLEKFSTYAVGLWRYLNTVEMKARLTFCQNGTGEGSFTYKCIEKNSSYYKKIVNQNKLYVLSADQIKNGIDLSVNNAEKLYVISGKQTPQNIDIGCFYNEYDTCRLIGSNSAQGVPAVQTTIIQDTERLGWTSIGDATQRLYDVDNDFFKAWQNEKESAMKWASVWDKDGNQVMYCINPRVCDECVKQKDYTIKNWNEYGNIEYCGSTEIRWCNNTKDVSYSVMKEKLQDIRHSADTLTLMQETGQPYYYRSYMETLDTACDNYNTMQYYQCNGHASRVYCNNVSPITIVTQTSSRTVNGKIRYYISEYKNTGRYSTQPCSNCTIVSGFSMAEWNNYADAQRSVSEDAFESLTTIWYYVCNGHTDHGMFISGKCDNYTELTAYQCLGHKQMVPYETTDTVTVCRGHVKCAKHYGCYNHTLQYCTGHIAYTFTRNVIANDSNDIYWDGWTYTVPNSFLWFDTSKTWTPKKNAPDGQESLAKDDWAGWTEDNKSMMVGMFTDDWYRKYGLGIKDFLGSTIDKSEIDEIKAAFGITNSSTTAALMANLDFAFDSIGRVSYYPDDKAVAAGYDALNKFGTSAPGVWVGSTQYGVHGLDRKYYADWVYRSTHDNASLPELTTSLSSCSSPVDAKTLPGTPIVFKASNPETGIYIGRTVSGGETVITYIGIGPNGWSTVLTSKSTAYTSTKVQK